MKFSIEKVYDKGIGKINEDEILIKDNIFAVFDGIGSLVKFLNKDGKTSGKIASEIAKNIFSDDKESLRNLAIKTNNLIRKEMKLNKVDTRKKEAVWGTVAAVLRIRKDFVEFFQIGDCLILVILKNGKPKLITKYYDQDMEAMIEWKKLGGKKDKEIWKKLKKQIIRIREKANKDYGSLNGDKKAVDFFNTGKFKLKNIDAIIIFTDGLLLPKKDPKENEDWNQFVRLYKKLGLRGLLKYVRNIENTDPDCFLYPRFRKHDDVAAIAIKIK
jgi:serine/threonine protein phosphatase PrpC